MTYYSSFFSSGLLAPPVTIYSRKDFPMHGLDDEDMVGACPRTTGLSPAAPSSPMAIPDDSDIETGFKVPSNRVATATTPEPRSRTLSSVSGKDVTTPNSDLWSDMATVGIQSVAENPSFQSPGGRRLRRRRSSVAGAASPLSGIKSPSKSVGHALELQRHLFGSPARARSSSNVSIAAAMATEVMPSGDNVVEQNTLLSRLRSGSLNSFKRRALRRVGMVPPAPPPTAPLPELPPSLMDTPVCGFLPAPKTAMPVTSRAALPQSTAIPPNDALSTMYRTGRERSYPINTQRIAESREA